MIIFLEATNMIIKRLEIKNLHGIYNYNVCSPKSGDVLKRTSRRWWD